MNKEKIIKLNLGCGKDLKKNFINVDNYEHPKYKLDLIINLSKILPIKSNFAHFVYSSHFLEHLNWIKGEQFLRECYRILKKNGKLRILVPDFEKIFKKYSKNDAHFFKIFKKYLNSNDYFYYKSLLVNKKKVKKLRKSNPPPSWHFSSKKKDIENIKLRARKFDTLIDIVDWFVHQHGEHKTVYDLKKIKYILKKIGFKKIIKVKYNYKIDTKSILRKKISLCIEANK